MSNNRKSAQAGATKTLKSTNIGPSRAIGIDLAVGDSYGGYPSGSDAGEVLHKYCKAYMDQALLGRGFEKFDGIELEEQSLDKLKNQTLKDLNKAGLGKEEAKLAIKEVEMQVTRALNNILGQEIKY